MSTKFYALPAAAFVGFMCATILSGVGQQQAPEDPAALLARRYAEANLELAEVQLEMRLAANARLPKTITERQLDRSRMKVAVAKEQLKMAIMVPKVDAVELHLKHAQLEASVTESNYQRALKANIENPPAYSELGIKELRLKAEVAQLRLAIWANPGTNSLSLLDHMHWQIERMSEELVELQQRVDKLTP